MLQDDGQTVPEVMSMCCRSTRCEPDGWETRPPLDCCHMRPGLKSSMSMQTTMQMFSVLPLATQSRVETCGVVKSGAE